MRAPFFVVVALLAVVLPAQAGKPSKNERRAIALINRAVSGATKSAEQCRQRPPEGTFTHDAPSSELLALLGILRRPATPEDSPPGDGMRFLPATDVYADYIRLAHTTDGRSWWIVPARDALAFKPMPHECLHRIHDRLRKLSHGEKPRVRRRALHFYNSLVKNNRRLARRKAHEGVFVFEKRGDGLGGGGGGVGITFIREHGEFGTSGTRTRRAHVNGLIPDGVATVTWTIGKLTGTEKVQDNMISFDVAADAARAFPEKMVWRDAGGKIVRVVRERRQRPARASRPA